MLLLPHNHCQVANSEPGRAMRATIEAKAEARVRRSRPSSLAAHSPTCSTSAEREWRFSTLLTLTD